MLVATCASALAAGGALAHGQSRDEERQEQRIELFQVPAAALIAAHRALNAPIAEAKEVGGQNGLPVYELEGRTQQGREVSVHVTAGGQVIRRESEREHDSD